MTRSPPAVALAHDRTRFLREAYDRHWSELCRYVRQNFGAGPPEPEDVAQAVFAKFAVLETPQRIENARAFLYAAARNLIADHHRRNVTRAAFVRDAAASGICERTYELDPERVLVGRERVRLLARALRALTPLQRRIITLNRWHGLDYGAIGAQLGLSPGAVRKQLERGLARCFESLRAAEE